MKDFPKTMKMARATSEIKIYGYWQQNKGNNWRMMRTVKQIVDNKRGAQRYISLPPGYYGETVHSILRLD